MTTKKAAKPTKSTRTPKCRNCKSPVRKENRHTCDECGARVCPYCETAHALTHNKETNTNE